MVSLINAYEVTPDDDDAFVAGWERVRDLLAAKGGYQATALHRALRPDVDLRFVDVARVDSPDTASPGAELPYRAHPGVYEVAREDGTPDIQGGVVLINPFEVPDEDDERFVAGWDRAREAMMRQQGYLGTRLHRSVGPADFRFVNVARWSSPLMFARALKRRDFQQAAQSMPFASHPALYQIVRESA